MSTMVERVAKAIHESLGYETPWATCSQCESAARAAIEAMKDAEPTDAMMSAMWSLSYSNTRESFSACWNAMIQEALKEQE